MDEHRKNDTWAIVWFGLSVLTLLSLVSYSPDDIFLETSSPNSPLHNWVGPFGAYMGWFIVLLFGRTAFFLVPLFLFWSLAKWSGKKSQKLWLKLFSTAMFITSACALMALVAPAQPTSRFEAGGLVGFLVSGFIANLFGNAAIFISLVLFLISINLATELLVMQLVVGVFKKIKSSRPVTLPPVPDKLVLPLARTKPEIKMPKPQVAAPKGEPPLAAAPPSKPQIKLAAPSPAAKPERVKPEGSGEQKNPARVAVEDEPRSDYRLPPLDLLHSAPSINQTQVKSDLEESSRVLEDTLRDFAIDAKVVEVEQGPTITRYELQPAAGVKVQKITSLENDIALAMRAHSVRIVAPIPGKSRVGIEVPNSAASTVYLKDVLMTPEFQKETSRVTIALGKDTAGAPMVCNLADMPHLLIAGATNTGKSVCINSLIVSMLFKSTPEELKFLMIDPKMVELHFYNDLPHQICPVITDKSKAPGALAWLIAEMERRYKILSKVGAKNITSFNEKVDKKEITSQSLKHDPDNENEEAVVVRRMPFIVLVIDELADLMLASANEVETAITRLAQLARAVGIHMILATQRPSVDIITGVIKANFPARIAFQVASKVDSRTILDENGADKLLGRGDLLLMDPRKSKLIRAQGAWVQDSEIEKVTAFIKNQRKPQYFENITQSSEKKQAFGDFKRDEVYDEAKRVVLETGQASVSMVQRRLGLGYTRAARLIDMMEEDGVVGPYRGAKPREILVERPKAQESEEKV